MQCPRCDFHIHTKYLGCANSTMEIPAIVKECERLGVRSIAMTDHLNTLDQIELHPPIREAIKRLDTELAVYFGVELNFTGRDEGFAFSQEIKEEHGFQFAIGGIHSAYLDQYDLEKLVEIQHAHHLKTCADPLVAVLVHPYWFSYGEFERNGYPWFDSMKAVPEAYAHELGQALKDTGTAVEINAMAMLRTSTHDEEFKKEYLDYLAIVAGEGARFSVGSDAHDISTLESIRDGWQAVEQLGLGEDQIWQPDCEPMAGARLKPAH